jgi:hypothetical protein
MRVAGFEIQLHDVTNVSPVKRKYGIPAKLESCHTASIGEYCMEGHVPADVVQEMLRKKPKIVGLAVPGMPIGSPGMEVPGRKDNYDIIAFYKSGVTYVFARR